MKLTLPLHYTHALVYKKAEKIAYSLNNFTKDLKETGKQLGHNNYYYHAAKMHMQKIVRAQLLKQPVIDCSTPKLSTLVIFRGSNTCVDIDNFSIIHKFAVDIIVREKHILDDNYKYLDTLIILDGGLDRKNPRAELSILEWEDVFTGCARDTVLKNLAFNSAEPEIVNDEYDLEQYD